MARALSLGGLPNSGLAFNAPHPPRRYCASHPYIVRRLILKDRATTSRFSPACTLRTARIRIASNVRVIQFASIILSHAVLESQRNPRVKKKVQLLMYRLIKSWQSATLADH